MRIGRRGKIVSGDLLFWRRIEAVITGLTRNQLGSNATWVRIPPSPPNAKRHPDGCLFAFPGAGLVRIHRFVGAAAPPRQVGRTAESRARRPGRRRAEPPGAAGRAESAEYPTVFVKHKLLYPRNLYEWSTFVVFLKIVHPNSTTIDKFRHEKGCESAILPRKSMNS